MPSSSLALPLIGEACALEEGLPHPSRAPNGWMVPFSNFLHRGILPDDVTDAHRLVQQAKSYKLMDGQLYCQSASGVLLQYVSPEEGKKLIHNIHASICTHHAALSALIWKAFGHGFY